MTDLREHGEIALAAFDRALAAEPGLDAPDFTDVTSHLCMMRDLISADCRKGLGRDDLLEQVNAVISCSLGGHFPLGKVPWNLMRSARASLQVILEQVAPAAQG